MMTKTDLKDIFCKYGFRPLKRLGANYLIDANIKDKIISAASLSATDAVLEIGPGLGALTIDLAGSGARLFAVDKDRKACTILTDIVAGKFPNLSIINADILKFDLAKAAEQAKVKVIGNLPYYITTPIIEYLIKNKSNIVSALVVVQKEVADRLMACPGTKDYGSISCFVQYHTRSKYLYTIKRGSFYPAPEVDSAIIRLEMSPGGCVKVNDESVFFRIIRGSFNQRRKSIINSLARKQVLDLPKQDLRRVLDRAGVDPLSRPEDLGLAQFAAIANSPQLSTVK